MQEREKRDSQKNLINHPDVILPPAPPQPHHARAPHRAADARHPHQRRVLDRVEHRVRHLAALGALLDRLALLDADECPGHDDEARQQDPRAEGREQIVRAGDFVQAQEHVDVARLCCYLLGGGWCVLGRCGSGAGFGWVAVDVGGSWGGFVGGGNRGWERAVAHYCGGCL